MEKLDELEPLVASSTTLNVEVVEAVCRGVCTLAHVRRRKCLGLSQ